MSEAEAPRFPAQPRLQRSPAQPARSRLSAPEAVHYPESDGRPMSETGRHWHATVDFAKPLHVFMLDRPDAYVGSDMFMYFREGDPSAVVSPDVFVAFGAPKEPLRDTWKLWQEGVAPAFVLEVTSKSTRDEDEFGKRGVYETLGVSEYWQFDPTGDYLDPILKGHRLGRNGRYEPLHLEARQNGLGHHSHALGLDLRLEGTRLRLFDPSENAYLLTHEENIGARLNAEKERQAAIEARHLAEAQRDEEIRRRQAAEALIAELRRQPR